MSRVTETVQRLDGWKAIAHHLGRSVRTVQRWEALYQLPVRRVAPDDRKSAVFAFAPELDQWLQLRDGEPDKLPVPPSPAMIETTPLPPSVRSYRYYPVMVVLILAALGMLLAAVSFIPHGASDESGPRNTLEKLTSLEGRADSPSASPDGNRIVFSYSHNGGQRDLFILDRLSAHIRPLTHTADSEWFPRWSPDGRTIACVRTSTGALQTDLVLLDPTTGSSQTLSPLAAFTWASSLSWTPDSRAVAAVHRAAAGQPFRIALFPIDGRPMQFLTAPVLPSYGDFRPTLSSDGRFLAYQHYVNESQDATEIWVQPLQPGNATPYRLTDSRTLIEGLALDRKSNGLVVSLTHHSEWGLWLIDKPWDASAGTRHWKLLHSMGNTATDPEALADGKLLFAGGVRPRQHLYLLDKTGGSPRRVCASSTDDWQPTWSPDARSLAFLSWSRTGWQVVLCDHETGDRTELTSFNRNQLQFPRWSPDGRNLVVVRNDGSGWGLWLVSAARDTPPRRVTALDNAEEPAWSASGDTIYFARQQAVWQVSAGGADARQVSPPGYARPLVDPADGSLYATCLGRSQLVRLRGGHAEPTGISLAPGANAFASAHLFTLRLLRCPVWKMQLVRTTLAGADTVEANTPDGLWNQEPGALAISRNGTRRAVALLDPAQVDIYLGL